VLYIIFLKKNSRNLAVILLFVAGLNSSLFASTGSNEPVDSEKNMTPMIMEHIKDSHNWHLWGHTSIPLPVILKTNEGIVTFMSSLFNHDKEGKVVVDAKGVGLVTYQNKIYYANSVANLDGSYVTKNQLGEVTNPAPLDFSITKNVASMFISVALLLFIFLGITSDYKKREGKTPKGMQSLLEPVIVFVRDEIARPNIGYRYVKYMPLLLTLFFFLLINNLMGLVPFFPGGANLTGNISVAFTLGVMVFLIVTLSGNKQYWKHIFLPNVPVAVYPIMLVVEVIVIFSKPFALIIRL